MNELRSQKEILSLDTQHTQPDLTYLIGGAVAVNSDPMTTRDEKKRDDRSGFGYIV